MQALTTAMPMLLMLALVPLLGRWATHLQLVDMPGGRKTHQGAVPLVGGLAMFLAFMGTLTLLGTVRELPAGFVAGVSLLVLLGVIDDRAALPALPRFATQIIAIWISVAWTGNILPNLGHLVSPSTLGLAGFAVAFTVFGILGVVNAVNLLDGADGLAGGIAVTALLSFLVVFHFIGAAGAVPLALANPMTVLLVLLGAVVGFLFFNLRTPWQASTRIFMGDAGSLFLGFLLGWFAVATTATSGGPGMSPVTALWILIVPLYDTVACMIRRIVARRSPMSPDRRHIHHLLEAWGLSAGRSVMLLVALNALGGAIGIAAWRFGVPDYVMFAIVMTGGFAYLFVSIIAWTRIEAAATPVGPASAGLDASSQAEA